MHTAFSRLAFWFLPDVVLKMFPDIHARSMRHQLKIVCPLYRFFQKWKWMHLLKFGKFLRFQILRPFLPRRENKLSR